MVENTKEAGKMIKDMGAVTKSSRMVTSTKETMKKVKLVVREYFNGLTGRYMMESGKTDLKKAMVSGEGLKEIPT